MRVAIINYCTSLGNYTWKVPSLGFMTKEALLALTMTNYCNNSNNSRKSKKVLENCCCFSGRALIFPQATGIRNASIAMLQRQSEFIIHLLWRNNVNLSKFSLRLFIRWKLTEVENCSKCLILHHYDFLRQCWNFNEIILVILPTVQLMASIATKTTWNIHHHEFTFDLVSTEVCH